MISKNILLLMNVLWLYILYFLFILMKNGWTILESVGLDVRIVYHEKKSFKLFPTLSHAFVFISTRFSVRYSSFPSRVMSPERWLLWWTSTPPPKREKKYEKTNKKRPLPEYEVGLIWKCWRSMKAGKQPRSLGR